MRPKVSFVILKGARRNIPHDEPLGQSETKTITLRIHSIQVIPSGLLMSYRISLSEGVAPGYSGSCPPGTGVPVVLFLPRIMRIGRMSVLWRGSEQNINQKNPLERMEGCALMSCFRLGLIRASS